MAPSAITESSHSEVVVTKSLNGVNLTNGNGIFNGNALSNGTKPAAATTNGLRRTDFLLDRHLRKKYPVIVGGKGSYLFTNDGRKVFDASSGAAVSCLGHGNERVTNAVFKEMRNGTPYIAAVFWASDIVDELCKEMIAGTGNKMARVYLTGSGTFHPSSSLKLLLTESRF